MELVPAILISILAVLGGIGVLVDRHWRPQPKGIGLRIIQFYGVFVLVPAVVILATTGQLEKQTTATLFGTIVGYLLSGIGKDESQRRGARRDPKP